MTPKFKTVKEFLTWLSKNNEHYDQKYLFFKFTTNALAIVSADSFEEYNKDPDWNETICGQFFEDFNIVKLFLEDSSWAVDVEIEESFVLNVPYQLENDFKRSIKEEEAPRAKVIVL